MLVVNASPHSVISFGVVKTILEHYGITPEQHDADLTQSLRLVYPIDAALAEKARSGAASLTDSATSNEQIRFFQHQRARRSYIKLAEYVAEKFGPITVHVANALRLDEPSREFLNVAARVCQWSVQLGFYPCTQAIGHIPRSEEQQLLKILASKQPGSQADQIVSLAFEYVNAGDAWSAVELGRIVQATEQSPRVWNLLALSHAMLDETLEAEFYYDRWGSSGQPLDTIRALYGKAMLYARHHREGLRSIARSAELLTEAYGLVHALSSGDRAKDAVVFDEVFNRNGYALILFRRGQVDEAIRLLRWGIDTLTATSEKVAIHRTVLIYNLAQCYKEIRDFRSAIATYEELLGVDPNMPEYHLESAKCFAASGDFESASRQCRSAIALDDTLASAWSLLGVYEGELASHLAAAKAHTKAAALDPDSPAHSTDAVYNLVLGGQLEEAAACAEQWKLASVPQHEAERRASLSAEIFIRDGRFTDALLSMDEALEVFPESEVLTQNREAILDFVQ